MTDQAPPEVDRRLRLPRLPGLRSTGRILRVVRRYGWMSVRALIPLIVFLSLLLGWIANQARIQREAVAEIRSAGGQVLYDWESQIDDANGSAGQSLAPRMIGDLRATLFWFRSLIGRPDGLPPAPEWLVKTLGVDYFGDVVAIDLRATSPDDLPRVLPHIGNLKKLQRLSFTDSTFGATEMAPLVGLTRLQELKLRRIRDADAALAQLGGMKDLRVLCLQQCQIHDSSLEYLQGLRSLEELELTYSLITPGIEPPHRGAFLKGLTNLHRVDLTNTRISAPDLSELEGLVNLEELSLSGTSVTDEVAVHFRTLAKLQILALDGTAISDAGLANIRSMTGLQSLNLSHSAVTDAGLAYLENLTQLSNLYLNDSRITDAGLVHLKNLNKLAVLSLFGTDVGSVSVEKLRAALPGAEIGHIARRRSPPLTGY